MERHNGERQNRKKIEKDKRSFKGNRDKQGKMLHNCYLSSRIQHSPHMFPSSSPPMSKYPLSPSSKCCGLFWGQFLWECPGAISSESTSIIRAIPL